LSKSLTDFQNFSSLFPGLSSPGKCHKIPGLSRFFRNCMNPAICVLENFFACHVFVSSNFNVTKKKLFSFDNLITVAFKSCKEHFWIH